MGKFDSKFESSKQDWGTPQYLANYFINEYDLVIDYAANEINKKLSDYISPEMDALTIDWVKNGWLNPPFSDVGKWIKYAYEQSIKHESVIACLTQARTNTRWFHNYCMNASDIYLICGRPKFVNAKYGLPQPLCVVVFGDHRCPHGPKFKSLYINNIKGIIDD